MRRIGRPYGRTLARWPLGIPRLGDLIPGLLLVLATTPSRGGDDAPDLTPPLEAPASSNPPRLVNPTRLPVVSTPAAAPLITLPRAEPRPSPVTPPPSTAVLALPGLTGLTPSRTREVFESAPAQDPDGGMTLDGPVEMRNDPSGRTTPSLSPSVRSGPARPSGAELAPIEDPSFEDRSQREGPLSSSTPKRASVPPSTARRIGPVVPPTAPPRRGRFFGLFPGPVVVSPHALETRPSTAGALASGRDLGLLPEDVKAKAAAEVALRKRIEKQARDAVGDRARSIEIHVDQKNAEVQARGVKFYQKRSVRKALEALPALSGMRSSIEVLD